MMTDIHPSELSQALLTWFEQHARTGLPWRDAPCGQRDPYKVWLSEIMLQQTTVSAVVPYFEKFTHVWPTIAHLATADQDTLMQAWAGLGYYARARNLMKCAQTIVEERQGQFPRHENDLLALPGIGPYTAAAIAAIAFNADTVPVDGNVIRVISRLYALDDIMPAHKDQVGVLASAMLPRGRAGDFAEAMMDLGARVCRPKSPACPDCPWGGVCQANVLNTPTAYPKKAPKRHQPTRYGWVFWIQRQNGDVWVERRPDKGLLGGMMGFPTTPWDVALIDQNAAMRSAPIKGDWCVQDGAVHHTFTHFHVELKVLALYVRDDLDIPVEGQWWPAHDQKAVGALPTLMRKVVYMLG